MSTSPASSVVILEDLHGFPKELRGDLPEQYRWSDYPIELDAWFDELGVDQIRSRGIWAIPSDDGQLHAVGELLKEFPEHGLDMMSLAAARGKVKIIDFLLREGVKPVHDKGEEEDDAPLPLHVAAYKGHLSCVKLLVERAHVNVDHPDDKGVTPLTPACMGSHIIVVKYLLHKGANINARPNIPPSTSNEQTALDWAAAVGSVPCIKLILKRAKQLSIDLSDLIAQNTIFSAACSSSFEALKLLLHKRNIPVPVGDNLPHSASARLKLTDSHKSIIEATLCYTLSQHCVRMLPFLSSYLTSIDPGTDTRNFTDLRQETYKQLFEALRKMPSSSEPAVQAAFQTICDLVIRDNAPFTNQFIQDNWAKSLSDGFFVACEENQVTMLKLIRRYHPEVDPNHTSVKFRYRTPLWVTAGRGHGDVIRYLFRNFSETIDPHLGNGEICNGATALFIAVWFADPAIVRLLLEVAHGPVESIYLDTSDLPPLIQTVIYKGDDAAAGPRPHDTIRRIVVTASYTYRLPVEVYAQDIYEKIYCPLTEAQIRNEEQELKAEDEIRRVVLEVTAKDAHWLESLQIRLTDEELLQREKRGRPLDMPSKLNILVGAMQAQD